MYGSNGEKLKNLKQKACLTTHNGTCIVLPRITASFQTLKKRPLKKLEEDAKNAKQKTSQSSTPLDASVVNHTKSIEELRDQLINQENRSMVYQASNRFKFEE